MIFGDCAQRSELTDARVGEKHVDPPQICLYFFENSFEICKLRYVSD